MDDYEDVLEMMDDPMDYEDEAFDEDEDGDDLDDMYDELVEAAGEDDLSEIWPFRKKKKRRGRGRGRKVGTARGRSAYRPPKVRAYVTHDEFKKALSRVTLESRRNAKGIKTVNSRVSGINRRVSGVVAVNRSQSGQIRKLDKQLKIDGALDLVENLESLDAFQLLKVAAKTGLLGDGKGSLSNPWLIGGVGLLLRNNPGLLNFGTGFNTGAV